MRPATLTFLGLGLITYGLKSFGPLFLGGGRRLPAALARLAELVPAPLLAALVLVSSVAEGAGFVFDARVGGVVAAGLALRFRANFLVTVLVAAAATAGLRWMGA
jgi:branched-subunit amino acid transport protein